MATINYNGMELEILEPQIFDCPKTCVVWDIDNPSPNGFSVKQVLAVLPMSFRKDTGIKPVITNDRTQWNFCALLPDPPKPRRATNRELARWLIEGKAQIRYNDSNMVYVGWNYKEFEDDLPCSNNVLVRKWSDTEWHEPTVDYMGLEDV